MFESNVSLRSFNTFGIDAKARNFGRFEDVETLKQCLASHRLHPQKLLVLGGGSNVLFTTDFEGLVLHNEIAGIEVREESDKHVIVRSGGGVSWHEFVMYCVQRNYGGVENLSLIPGSVGASPLQNIGAYGVELKDVFHQLEAIDVATGETVIFGKEDCAFGYRESIFKNRYKDRFVITHVSFRLEKQPHFNTSYGAIEQELDRMNVQSLSVKAISDAVINIRTSKLPDPKLIGNAGSFFKNPMVPENLFTDLKTSFPGIVGFPGNAAEVKLAAGWLIEQCGWKGFRSGDAGCYPKQALVLVNYGNARGEDIYALSESIIQSVRDRFNVELEREVNIIGAPQ